ncbi:MAG TPA: 5'-methylthioadenosine/S-adenosylhomocysteine nucleosidase [Gemmatimonadaceae bacterium]|nr:5'-methylthioadenosine/S-adenosylhomocysteine nucleosidase [Gemmatimonadaceae bacterium]
MLTRTFDPFTLSDLQRNNPAENNWFSEHSSTALAGRCLLDVLEYLRAVPNFPGRFREVANAHTIRLTCRCLSDPDLDRRRVLDRMRPRIVETGRQLRAGRRDRAPHYGDDFWDWAAVLEGFIEVQEQIPDEFIDDEAIGYELNSFFESVKAHLKTGLTIAGNNGEWYGPAMAVIATRVLQSLQKRFGRAIDKLTNPLHKQALELIQDFKYRNRVVLPHHVLWHYGQVVADFGAEETRVQANTIADFSWIDSEIETSDKVYALARVLQGALHVEDSITVDRAMRELYSRQNLSRPLGQGLMGDNVKGSLNVLDALWPTLDAQQKERIRSMIDTLLLLHIAANTVGIVVAVEREADAIKRVFAGKNTTIERVDAVTFIIHHGDYRLVVCMGKSLVDATGATQKLIDKHHAKWVIVCGIAGSLGRSVDLPGEPGEFRGPDKGHVVVATSLAAFRIRDKVREEIQNAGVPLQGHTWTVIPTDPVLFRLAHEAGAHVFNEEGQFHEGLIVTGTGIKDARQAKNEILTEFPGGLAIEEEGYVVGLLCMSVGTPYLIVRGISDRAEGDKKQQQGDPKIEEHDQQTAARAAAQVVAQVVELLSQRW